MARDRYYPQLYKCPSCGMVQEHYIWASQAEEAKHNCTSCGSEIRYTEMYEEKVEKVYTGVGKMSIQAVQAERKKRSTDHFKKEVMPTLSRQDKKHFERKFSK